LAVTIASFLAEKEIFLAANQDFKVREEVGGEITTSEVALPFAKMAARESG
jgi:hypothetical protein